MQVHLKTVGTAWALTFSVFATDIESGRAREVFPAEIYRDESTVRRAWYRSGDRGRVVCLFPRRSAPEGTVLQLQVRNPSDVGAGRAIVAAADVETRVRVAAVARRYTMLTRIAERLNRTGRFNGPVTVEFKRSASAQRCPAIELLVTVDGNYATNLRWLKRIQRRYGRDRITIRTLGPAEQRQYSRRR